MKKNKKTQKVATNKFSDVDLSSLQAKYQNLRNQYTPDITEELTLEEFIIDEALDSFSLTRYFLIAIITSTITALLLQRIDYLFMPVLLIAFSFGDIISSAKKNQRRISTELKLVKLALRCYI